jgi:hypothetical protein
MKNFAMASAIFSALRVANVFGVISPKMRISSVIIPVEIQIAILCSNPELLAISILILAARDAVNVFTRLFPINMVIRSFSVSSLNLLSSLAPGIFCLISH